MAELFHLKLELQSPWYSTACMHNVAIVVTVTQTIDCDEKCEPRSRALSTSFIYNACHCSAYSYCIVECVYSAFNSLLNDLALSDHRLWWEMHANLGSGAGALLAAARSPASTKIAAAFIFVVNILLPNLNVLSNNSSCKYCCSIGT